MKCTIKKIISIMLVLTMLITSAVFVKAADDESISEGVELTISNETTFSWGNSIVFEITIKNNTGNRITDVKLVSEPKGMSKYFQLSEESTNEIDYITPGASRTVELIYTTKSISNFKSFFRAIATLFKLWFGKFSRSYAYTRSIKIGLTNALFGIDVDYEISEQSSFSSLDDPDPDVEIYSFDTDTYDILIGESKTVKFTSEIFANIDMAGKTVTVFDDSNNRIGVMNDSGTNGDSTANDGIYTLSTSLSSNEVCTKAYHSEVNGLVSEDAKISFYKHYSQLELGDITGVIESVDLIASYYTDNEGNLIDGKLNEAMQSLSREMNLLVSEGIVSSYEADDNVFTVYFVNGADYRYQFSSSGTDSVKSVVSSQPYKQDEENPYSTYSQSLSDEATDGSARKVDSTFSDYTFSSVTTGNELNISNDSNYDRHEVSLAAMKNIINADVVTWHGHGGYVPSVGSFMATGELYTDSLYSQYEADISADRIIVSNGRFLITGGFIEKYAGDLSGHFVYMGTCSSSTDMEDGNTASAWELASEFNKKGAVVIGNTGAIQTVYNTRMEAAVYSRLCVTDENGNYYTLSEALDYAKSIYGNTDINGTEVKIYPNTETAGNFRLYNNDQSKIAGVIKNASNRSTVANALIRVCNGEGELVASVRTNSNGKYEIPLAAGEYVVNVSCGGFKTAKMGVTVRENTTTWNETFLLIFNGLTDGYANGNTINAITGRLLPNVQINIRRSWGNREGEIIDSITSNSNGYYEVYLPAGLYTFECYIDDFITTYKNIIAYTFDYDKQDISIAPEMQDNYYRVVLTWGENPSDLDSHLFGKTDNYSYHVYYSDKNGLDANGEVVANLDVDDTTSYGPETTTFYVDPNGQYDFYIDWYSGSGTWASSGGKVEVYNGAYLVGTYYVPSVSNRAGSWKVFSVINGTYTEYNTMCEDIY